MELAGDSLDDNLELDALGIKSCSISSLLIKVTVQLEKKLHLIKTSGNDFNRLISDMCKLAILCLSSEIKGFENSIAGVFSLLQKINETCAISDIDSVKELIKAAFNSIKQGILDLPKDAVEFIFLVDPILFEKEVMDLLKHCSNADVASDLVIKSLLLSHMLVPVCASCPVLFQKFVSIVAHIWLESEGRPALQKLLKEYMNAIQSASKGSLIHLFPANVQSLVILYSIEPDGFSHSVIWQSTLEALNLKVCSREEINVLMVLYPLWYNQLLKDVFDQASKEAVQLIKLLWSCQNEKSIRDDIERFKSVGVLPRRSIAGNENRVVVISQT